MYLGFVREDVCAHACTETPRYGVCSFCDCQIPNHEVRLVRLLETQTIGSLHKGHILRLKWDNMEV